MHKQTRIGGTDPVRQGTSAIRRIATLTAVVALTLGTVPTLLQAAPADDYTREIMAEGSRLETLGQAQRERETLEKSMAKARPAAAKKTAPAPVPTPAAAGPQESQATFETKLRNAFPASFALYSLLTPEEKTAVRAEYDQSSNPGAARFHPVVSKIISLSAKKR